MLPRLRIVLLLGVTRDGPWKVFESEHPQYLAGRDIKVRWTYHTTQAA